MQTLAQLFCHSLWSAFCLPIQYGMNILAQSLTITALLCHFFLAVSDTFALF